MPLGCRNLCHKNSLSGVMKKSHVSNQVSLSIETHGPKGFARDLLSMGNSCLTNKDIDVGQVDEDDKNENRSTPSPQLPTIFDKIFLQF